MSPVETPRHPSSYPPAVLPNALGLDPGRPLVQMAGGPVWTAGEFRDAVSRVTQAMVARGATNGARVALLAGNSIDVIVVQNAVSYAGVCLIALHPMGSVDDHLFSIEDGQVEALIYDPAKFEPRVAEIVRRTNRIKTLLALGDGGTGENLLEASKAYTPAPLVAPVLTGNEILRLAYSGGTTGKPKAIPASPRVSGAMLQIMLAEWDWPKNPRALACAPLSHAGGTLFTPVVLKGGSMVVLPGFDPLAVLQAIETYKINCTMLVPTMIYALLDHPRFDEFDLSSLEFIYYGASLMSPTRLREAIERIGPVFFQFYGQAEAPMTVTIMRREEHDVTKPLRLASCGRPVPWVDVALLDNENRPVADGEPGEICVRGPLVMNGYHEREELNRETFAGGWLHTGDVAVKDPDGFLRIVDRKKDMIVSGGFNVYPSEVENVIAGHPAVAQVAVFGIADEKWGEAVTAAVVLRAGAKATPADIMTLVRDAKGAHQTPKSVLFLDAIPATAIGKPDKKALRVQFAPKGD